MKLSKTQQQLIDQLRHDLEVIRSYPDYDTFYDNCGRDGKDQWQLTTGSRCNYNYATSERAKANDPKHYEHSKQWFGRVVTEGVMIVYAKTETTARLEKEGLIEIVKQARYKGDCEYVIVK